MGSIYKAKCPCGFNHVVVVGGSRSDYQSNAKFPFYCKTCGLVDVNICQKPLCCPTCNSRKIKVYGKAPISLETSERELSWDAYSAGPRGHLCPQCKNHTLYFQLSIMFD